LLAGVFPFAIGGSVVVEVVFSLPGMGKLTLDALQARDYPVVYAVVMLSALLTLMGYLIADFLYARADPRIRIHTSSPS
jgi:peptide/nickel transport system permease protein